VSRSLLPRLLLLLPTLFGVALVVFVLLRVVPGDPIAMMIPPGATDADVSRLRAAYGLDRGIAVQFLVWLGALLRGDLGTSITLRQSVAWLIAGRLPATLELVLLAVLFAGALGTALALIGGYFRAKTPEWIVDGFCGLGAAVPDFLWGLVLILVFGVAWSVLPISGRIDPARSHGFATGFLLLESLLTGRWSDAGNLLTHATLPATALALPFAALIARTLKASLAEAEAADYVQVARARGYSRSRLLLAEALPNAALPTITLAGVQVIFLIGGTVLVERIFSYEGLGNMAIDALINRDLPLIQGVVLCFAVLFVALNLAVDLIAWRLDPRLRHG
jgi:ABC-type dipeptide/oligopeptide/nickel transport system permease component